MFCVSMDYHKVAGRKKVWLMVVNVILLHNMAFIYLFVSNFIMLLLLNMYIHDDMKWRKTSANWFWNWKDPLSSEPWWYTKFEYDFFSLLSFYHHLSFFLFNMSWAGSLLTFFSSLTQNRISWWQTFYRK